MSPLCVKLGLMKNSVKPMAKCNFSSFNYFCDKFPDLGKAKLKEGIL